MQKRGCLSPIVKAAEPTSANGARVPMEERSIASNRQSAGPGPSPLFTSVPHFLTCGATSRQRKSSDWRDTYGELDRRTARSAADHDELPQREGALAAAVILVRCALL